jgi:hypothetical protein
MQSGYCLSFVVLLVSHVLVGQTGTQPSAAAPEQQSVQPAAPAGTLSASNHYQNVSLGSAKLQVDSIPPGADIELDGSFVGNTPSDVQVAEGNHMVVVRKPGFKHWERQIKAIGGSSVRVVAELEKNDTP